MEAYVVSAGIGEDYVIYGVYSTLQGAKNRVESLKRLKFNLKRGDDKHHLFSNTLYTDKYLLKLGINLDQTVPPQPCGNNDDVVTSYEFPSYEKYKSIYVYINKVALDEDIEE